MTQTVTGTVEHAPDREWIRPISIIAIATLVMVFWSLTTRQIESNEPFDFETLNAVNFDPYYFGLGALEFAIPLLLIVLFSRAAIFRRVVTDQSTSNRDWLLLFLAFSGIQLLFFLYKLNLLRLEESWVSWGYFVVVVAALVGGWRLGVAVGAVTMLCSAAFDYYEYQFWSDEFVFDSADFILYFVILNLKALAALWVGLVVGVWADWRKERRFDLLPALLVGIAVELAIFAFLFLSNTYNEFVTERLASNLFISVIALAAFLIVVRTVLDEALRQRSERDRLELAQTQLDLTQTQLALTEAELRALHAQINPHFFFNALNTIRYFIRTNPDQARDLLANLSDVFQRVMSAGEYVALSEEIGTVKAYLALEQARLEERLNVIWSVLARDLLDTPVPSLVLQPLVENAVVHGVSQNVDGGTIHIVINRVGGDLFVQVADDGPGFDVDAVLGGVVDEDSAETDPSIRQPIGLRNIDQRLRRYYGDSYQLHIDSEPEQGTTAVIRIPLEAS